MGSASSPSCLSGSGLQVLSPARPGAHSCPLLPERQKTPLRCWGLGDRVVCKPRSSPCPPHGSPTSFQREGRDYGGRGGGVGWGWMQFQPQSRAPWLEAIFSLGPRAACTLVLSPHSPPAKPHPTGLPADHSHAQGTHVYQSGGRQWGQCGGGGVQERGTGPKALQGWPVERSGLLTQQLATRCRLFRAPQHRRTDSHQPLLACLRE